MALLISYVTPWTPAQLLPVVNLPFILFGLFTMGRAFAAKTLAVSLSLGAAVHIAPEMLLPHVDPAFAWIAGGTLLGMGILCFARHNASIGGTGVVTLWMQKRYGINAGKAQMVFDACLFLVAAFIQPWEQLAWSLVGTVAMNLVLVIWHKPGRYRG
ncbi:YitT family protein [Pseudomonas sp. KCJK8806]|uniref:YitT family protein n=1 Tax=Pseudomonas sp. KCJK8806 TaxID=3344559 RepID=UPI00390609A2